MALLIRRILFALCFAPAIASAESGPLGWGRAELTKEMETDRPDFTEGTQTVEPGHLQLEAGYSYVTDSEAGIDTDEHTAPELLLRLGIVDDLELRLGWNGYQSIETDSTREEGAADPSIAVKHRIRRGSESAPAIALIGELSLPAGSSEVSSDEVEVGGKLLLAYDLGAFGVSGNGNFATPIGEDGRYLEFSGSLSLGAAVAEAVGCYFEYFGFYPAEDVVETTEHYLNGGFTFAAGDNLQFDVRAGFGLNNAADDFFTGAGLAFRL